MFIKILLIKETEQAHLEDVAIVEHHSNYLWALKTSSSAVKLQERDYLLIPPALHKTWGRTGAGIPCHARFSSVCFAPARKHFLQAEHAHTLLASPEEKENWERRKRWGGLCSRYGTCLMDGREQAARGSYYTLVEAPRPFCRWLKYALRSELQLQACLLGARYQTPEKREPVVLCSPHLRLPVFCVCLRSFACWAAWSGRCGGTARGEGTLACSCQKPVSARPLGSTILVLTVRGYRPASQNPFPLLWFAGPGQGGAGLGSVRCFQRRCVPWAFPRQLASLDIRQAEYYRASAGKARSPALEQRPRSEVIEGEGQARALSTSSLVLGGPSLGTGEAGSFCLEPNSGGLRPPTCLLPLTSSPTPFTSLNQHLP